ncbi:hypothetical protein V6N12_045361 [Hibiscus sabdariffa]|uniref:Uncharacterized protein n=1 Tax=Hibiscus sabdariffa TaxID=183260 RepID=A0ABR2G2S3_9ROSI
MIPPATWRQLTGAATKEKGNERMSEPTLKSGATTKEKGNERMRKPTLKSGAAKSLPEELMPVNLLKYLSSINQNQGAIFKKIQRMEHKSIQLWHYINGQDKTCNTRNWA